MLGVVPVVDALRRDGRLRPRQLSIPFGNAFFLLLLFGLTLPFEVVVVPLYYQMQRMGLLNTRLGLILPLIGLNMPFAVFWMRTHFQSMPNELSESSGIDGAGPGRNSATSSSRWRSRLWPRWRADVPRARGTSSCSPSCSSTTRTSGRWPAPCRASSAHYSTDVVLLNAGALLIMAPVDRRVHHLPEVLLRAMLAGAVKG